MQNKASIVDKLSHCLKKSQSAMLKWHVPAKRTLLEIHSSYELDMNNLYLKKTQTYDEPWQADVSPATECLILNINAS